MDTLFLDANVLFSAAYRTHSGILRLWSPPHAKLITSTYASEEARRNLKQPEQLENLKKILHKVHLITEGYDDNLIPTDIKLASKDRPILAAAIAAKANYLITGDYKDFGCYFSKNIAGVIILPPAEYLSILGQN